MVEKKDDHCEKNDNYSVMNTLLDIDKEWCVDPEKFVTMGRATPFQDWKLQGENLLTIYKGEIVYEAL